MYNREKVRALVSAFNVHNYARNTVKTNFTLQSRDEKDCIVVSFDKSMDTYQCGRYLDSIKRKIIREFYGIEESNGAEILDTAKLIFDVNSFPFYISDRDWSWDEQHGFKFVTPVDEGVIFNLKSHLASSLEKDVLEDMRISSTTVPFNKGKYLCCSKFPDKKSRKEFEREFLSRMKARYENVPKNPLKVEGNDVYIRDVFDDARFIDSVTRYKAWLTGMDLGVGNDVDHSVKSFKNMIIRSTYSVTKVMIDGFILAPPLNGRVVSILTPITQNGKEIKLLTKEEVRAINRAFNNAVLDDISGRTQAKLSVNGSSETYGIDFSNPYISHCVITKIIENSVINKDHELSIDPELRLQALSRSPSTELSDTKLESPTCSRKKLEGFTRQGSEKEGPLYNHVDVPGTGGRCSPSSQVNSIAVNRVIEPKKCVVAAENVPASTNLWTQQPNPLSFAVFYAQSSDISVLRFQPPTPLSSSGPSSWEVAVQNVSAALSQDLWSFSPPPPFTPSSSNVSGSQPPTPSGPSSFKSMPAAQPQNRCSLPPPLISSSSNVSGSQPPTPSEPSSSKRPASVYSADSGYSGSLERPQPNSSITTSAVPGISESGEGSNVATVPVDNKRPQSLSFTSFSTCASDKTVEDSPKDTENICNEELKKQQVIESPKKQNKIDQFFRNLSIRRSKSNGKTTKDILQFDKETFSSFSSGMQKVLSLSLSLDMIRNLFPHFPIGKREKLILLARSEKVKKSHSSPEEIEQLLLSLLPEEREICSLLFFPDRKNETYVDLSPGAKEQVVLFWEVLRGRGFNSTSSEESGIFSGSSSQGSTSDDKDELEASGRFSQSGRSSVSSNSSTSTVRTKVDSLKLEQCSSKGIGGWI
ncbi:MAG: hypothetical protein TV42_02140 [Wolbachia endosymbiont of Dactylopius coccus]|nr:MAG: hypothetical protein TV42_02140 [Wolbachia endosymbiont of Dactylopius coccus]